MNYSQKLKDPRWQKLRLFILNRDSFTCKLCNDTETELHIHHKKYLPGNEPWEYGDDNFITLCKHCHAVVENHKSEEVLAISKQYNSDFNRYILMSIINDEGELKLSIQYYTNGLIDGVGIKRSTFLRIEKLFKYSEKLISENAK